MEARNIEEQLLALGSLAKMESWIHANSKQASRGRVSRSDTDRLGEYLNKNRRKEAAALALSLALMDGDGAVAGLRRAGVLRASRSGFNAGGLREVVHLLLRLNNRLSMKPERVRYLRSLMALYSLAPDARRLRDGLIARLRSRRGIAIKSFLAFVNQAFASGWQGNHHAPTDQLAHHSVENLCSAVSRIIALHREELGFNLEDIAYTDPQAVNPLNGTYRKDLLDALRLEELIQAEILIDGLPYLADVEGNSVIVRSIDPNLEKSVRLGYVQMDLQVAYRRMEIDKFWNQQDSRPTSLQDVFRIFYEKSLDQLVEFKPKPLPRIAFNIPGDSDFFKPLASDKYFLEDILMLLQLGAEDYDELTTEAFEIVPGVRSIDLFKVMRFFALISHAMQRELKKVEDMGRQQLLALHSVIPCLRRAQFVSLLGYVLTEEKAEQVLDLLTLDDVREHVDLQYTPFICVQGIIAVAPALVANSNLVRNVVCANKLNDARLGDDDPMQRAVVEALVAAGFLVGVEVSVTIKGTKRDTDIVAYRDETLYLFECKNAYHPCSPHEMRNSYEHVKKAGEQLTLRRRWFGERANQAKLWEVLGWNVPAPSAVRTGVLTANRVFTGAMIEGHPVRQAHEFINVILRGRIRGTGGAYRFWVSDTLATADIDIYLGNKGLLEDHFEALRSIRIEHRLGAKTLAFDSWYYDLEKFDQILAERYLWEPDIESVA